MRVLRGMCPVCVLTALAAGVLVATGASAQAVKASSPTAKASGDIRIDYIGYRAARWEQGNVVERDAGRLNQGGLIQVYFTNTGDHPLRVKSYQINGRDGARYRLDGAVAWDRMFVPASLTPGASGIVEIDAVDAAFKPGSAFAFALSDQNDEELGKTDTTLAEDSVQVTAIRVLPGLRAVDVHVRHRGNGRADLTGIAVLGAQVAKMKWVGESLTESGHAIVHAELASALTPAQTITVKLSFKENGAARAVYANRRAFEDSFPIGVWTGEPDTYAVLRKMHVDTVVKGGAPQDPFFVTDAAKYGLRAIVSAEGASSPDTLRALGDSPLVNSWLLSDEPDTHTVPAVMEYVDASVKHLNASKPTFMTLCRNGKFFEYAPIADIPCMDHYCVAAPSSSVWPKPFGTRLEETAYYTRDLKAASEPKPVWVWSQALANWNGRPQRVVPTPDELAAQLTLNLGRGAKGVLWFNYDSKIAEKYPEMGAAMQGWGRALSVLREDLLASDTISTEYLNPAKVDASALASYDKLVLCVTNLNYEINPKGYPFTPVKGATVSVVLPSWLKPTVALLVGPDGVKTTAFSAKDGRAQVAFGDLDVCRIVVLANDAATESAYKDAYAKALEEEHKEY